MRRLNKRWDRAVGGKGAERVVEGGPLSVIRLMPMASKPRDRASALIASARDIISEFGWSSQSGQ